MIRVLSWSVCVGLMGCTVDQESADWAWMSQEDRLEREPPIADGCGDYFIYGRNMSDRRAMTVAGTGLLARAAAEGGEFEQTIDLPTTEVTIEMLRGSNLSRSYCSDVVYPDGAVIRGVAVPTSGTLILRARTEAASTSWYTPGYVDVILEGVSWESLSGVSLVGLPEDIELYDVWAGWFPG